MSLCLSHWKIEMQKPDGTDIDQRTIPPIFSQQSDCLKFGAEPYTTRDGKLGKKIR